MPGTRQLLGGPKHSRELWFWRVDRSGKKHDIDLKIPPKYQDLFGPLPDVSAVSVTSDGQIVAVAELIGGRPSLLRMTKDGKVTSVALVTSPERRSGISKVVKLANGGFLLVGHSVDNALAVRIGRGGEKLWEKVIDRGQVEAFFDAVAIDDEGFLLVGVVGKLDDLAAGRGDIWFVRMDGQGNVGSETMFRGRLPSIAKGQNESYVIAYDESDTPEPRIRLKSFTPHLVERWGARLESKGTVLTPIEIAPVPSGGFVIVTSGANFKLWAARTDEQGKVLWEYSGTTQRGSAAFDLVSQGPDLVIAHTLIYWDKERRKSTDKVRVIRFSQE